ncbi:hypothetical protein MKW94_012828, partial [Papaver nudicaule]|nr:hypothetical protein [Papaver nudicaule]
INLEFQKKFEELNKTIDRKSEELRDCQRKVGQQKREIGEKDKRIEELTMSVERQDMQIEQMKKRRMLQKPEPHHSPSECNEGTKCQLCMAQNHEAASCPFMNTRCGRPNCTGFRMIMLSKTSKNPGRVFLKCQVCNKFEWMDDVRRSSSSASPIKYNSNGCFKCGEHGHWANACPRASDRF